MQKAIQHLMQANNDPTNLGLHAILNQSTCYINNIQGFINTCKDDAIVVHLLSLNNRMENVGSHNARIGRVNKCTLEDGQCYAHKYKPTHVILGNPNLKRNHQKGVSRTDSLVLGPISWKILPQRFWRILDAIDGSQTSKNEPK